MNKQARIVGCVLSTWCVGSCASEPRQTDAGGFTKPDRADAGREQVEDSLQPLLLAGLCGYPFVFELSSCEGIDAMAVCANEKCDLDSCTPPCAELLNCTEAEGDACSDACTRTSECSDCLSEVVTCIPACLDKLVCATTTPGGACDRMRSCCSVPDDVETQQRCRSSIDLIANLTGDQGCINGSKDQTFVDGYPDVSKCVDEALARDP